MNTKSYQEDYLNREVIKQRNTNDLYQQQVEEIPTVEALLGLMQILLSADRKKSREMTDQIGDYFNSHPYTFDLQPIEFLMQFFDSSSQFGLSGVSDAVWILSCIVNHYQRYEYNERSRVELCTNYLLTPQFLSVLYPYFFQCKEVIQFFVDALKFQRHFREPTVLGFLISNNCFLSMNLNLKSDFPFLTHLMKVIKRILSYYMQYLDEIPNMNQIIHKAIDIFYTCPPSFHHLKRFIGKFGEYHLPSALYFLHHPNFTVFCQTLIDEETIRSFFIVLIDVLHNPDRSPHEVQDEEGNVYNHSLLPPGSRIRHEIRGIQDTLLTFIISLIEKEMEGNYDICFDLISLLDLSEEFIQHSIDKGFVQHLFTLFLNSSLPFRTRATCLSAICQFIQFANMTQIQYFLSIGFFDLMEDWMNTFMVCIPHQILDTFETLITFSETVEECHEWSELIFDNETILECLQKAADKEYNIRHDDYDIDVDTHGQSILVRRYNMLSL